MWHQKAVHDYVREKLGENRWSLCMGGAPRDWYFGEPANDLDFFLSVSTEVEFDDDFREITYRYFRWGGDKLYVGGLSLKLNGFEEKMNYFDNDHLGGNVLSDGVVVVLEKYIFGQKCQFMLCDREPGTVMSGFDCNMSKIGSCHGGNKFIRNREFIKGELTKQLIFSNNVDLDGPYAMKYRSYFPDYEYGTKQSIKAANLEEEV